MFGYKNLTKNKPLPNSKTNERKRPQKKEQISPVTKSGKITEPNKPKKQNERNFEENVWFSFKK